MTRYQILNALLHGIIFFLGAGIGSFLNVVIYRLPRGLSVNQPRRSFCPSCKYQIPFYLNIPLVSWLLLRGRCAKCASSISSRYFWVELLVGILFYAVFLRFGGDWADIRSWGPLVLCLWIFVSLLVAGTFIDLEHFILPHEITIGGTVVGLLCALALPELLSESTHLRGFLLSLGSAALGLGILWIIVELGKLALGRKRHHFESPVKWEVAQPDDTAPPVIRLDLEELAWEDVFTRSSDRLIVSSESLSVNAESYDSVTAELWMEKLRVLRGNDLVSELPWEDVRSIHGTTREVIIPREAMGFGDVLFLMMIGAFIGWQAVLFTLVAASIIGTIIPTVQRVTGFGEWGAKIPFGPYLATGALLWLFCGPEFMDWYLSHLNWRAAPL
jgi:leader peptidase (prepilin peptidase) / N-methyltransferase